MTWEQKLGYEGEEGRTPERINGRDWMENQRSGRSLVPKVARV
jgi:hypothetical protein